MEGWGPHTLRPHQVAALAAARGGSAEALSSTLGKVRKGTLIEALLGLF